MKISVALITCNEEKNIRTALDSVSWADEVVIVDSGSRDKTVDIARERGVKVFLRDFDDFSSQKNYCLEKITCDWVLFLDADEEISGPLQTEIVEKVRNTEFSGFLIPRKNIIFGREMMYGGHQGDRHLRLFRKASGKFVNSVHEKVVVEGSIGVLSGSMIHHSTEDISAYIKKLDFYTDLEACIMARTGKTARRCDLILKPVGKFLSQYFIKLGFLDGFEGFVFYFLSAVNVFVKYAKWIERSPKSQRTG